MTSVGPKQACLLCRRRKVKVSTSNTELDFPGDGKNPPLTRSAKCDSLPTCTNCHTAKVICQYSSPGKRGPRPPKQRESHHRGSFESATATIAPSVQAGNRAVAILDDTVTEATSESPLSTNTTASHPIEPSRCQIQQAIRIHLDLLTELRAATPCYTAASIANNCIFLHTRYTFGATPMCHEGALRTAVRRFFGPQLAEADSAEHQARVFSCFTADNQRAQLSILRSVTLLTALCAAVAYGVPESLLPEKALLGPLFLRASRDLLGIYEHDDIESPDSSSLSIRLLHSSAIQHATGKYGVAFHILNQAGLLAMKMRLYDERSLEGRAPVEENLLRNIFWHLYVCDKTALALKRRSVTIHESLFETEFTLQSRSRNPVPLFNYERGCDGIQFEQRCLDGFHVIRRLWTLAARLLQIMASNSQSPGSVYIDTIAPVEIGTQVSEAYIAIITLGNSFPPWMPPSEQSSPNVHDDAEQRRSEVWLRQRTTHLIDFYTIRALVLKSAIQNNMAGYLGLSTDSTMLALKQIELAQDFLNVLESVPFVHVQVQGEHFVSKYHVVPYAGNLLFVPLTNTSMSK